METIIQLNEQGIVFLENDRHAEALEMFRNAASLMYTYTANNPREKRKRSCPASSCSGSLDNARHETSRSKTKKGLSSTSNPGTMQCTPENPDACDECESRGPAENKRSKGTVVGTSVTSQEHIPKRTRRNKRRRHLPSSFRHAVSIPSPEESGFIWSRPFTIENQEYDGTTNSIEYDVDHPDWTILSIMILFNMSLTYQLSSCGSYPKLGSSSTQNALKLYSMCLDLATNKLKQHNSQHSHPLLDIVVMASLNNSGVLHREQEADYESALFFFDSLANYTCGASRALQQQHRQQLLRESSNEDVDVAFMMDQSYQEEVYNYFMLNSLVLRNVQQGAAAA